MSAWRRISILCVFLSLLIGQTAFAQSIDSDGDGISDIDDNCPAIYNAYQEDLDMDEMGDVCEEHIRTGRFAFYLEGIDEDRPLRNLDGSQIQPLKVL